MTLLAPLWLAVAAIAAAGVVALHLITTARAPQVQLPTARFVPAGVASAAARSTRPADLLLLALRVAALLLLGAAFARPVRVAPGARLRRVVVADVSRSARPDVGDSVRAWWRAGDALVVMDSAARAVTRDGASGRIVPTGARGSISAGLAAAMHAAGSLARAADSVELVLVTPLTGDEIDSASVPLARAWPGRLRVVRTSAAPASWPAIVVEAPAGGDDALAATAALLSASVPRGATTVPVRVVRGTVRAMDSLAARGGAAVVSWPRANGGAAHARGVTDGRATVVAPFIVRDLAGSGVVIARWADGTPAAAERPLGLGCLRTVGIVVSDAGDVTLQEEFVALARTLMGPCVGRGTWPAASDAVLHDIVREGPAAPAAALRAKDDPSPLAPWLLGAALALLVAELWVRPRAEAAS